MRGDALEAHPFDERSLETSGPPVPIVRPVATWSQKANWGWFSASEEGDLAYLSAGAEAQFRLEWRDRTGRKVGSVGQAARYGQIALSPDGRQVAAEIGDAKGETDLWVLDVARGVASRVTARSSSEWDPVWSPTGRELVFQSDRERVKHLYRKSLDRGEAESRLRDSAT